jgi:uncharacterized protein (UPF0335 family)
MIDKLLRHFVCDQLKALMEKLETQEIDARSLRKIGDVISELKLTRFERYVVGRVYKRARRLSDMNRLMEEIIMGQMQDNIDIDINARLRAAMNNSMTNTALGNGQVPAQQNPYQNAYPQNLTPPEQTKRLIVRPKARA